MEPFLPIKTLIHNNQENRAFTVNENRNEHTTSDASTPKAINGYYTFNVNLHLNGDNSTFASHSLRLFR